MFLIFLTTFAVSSAQTGQLKVVATFSIIGDWVQNVVGEVASVDVLVGPDADAHGFQPSPRDVITLAQADLIFENGLGFETWLDDLYAASRARAPRVAVTEGIEPILAGEAHGGAEHEAEHHPGEVDPHAWHDVQNAIRAVEVIRDTLIEADPDNAAIYRENARAYLAELAGLDEQIREQASGLQEERRKLVTNHDTFGYFARAYGFEVLATLLPLSTDTDEVAAGELAALIDTVRAAGVRAIFVENVGDVRLAEMVAQATGARLAPALYTDALGAAGSAGATYLKMMRYNLGVMLEALAE
ncbi:MAG: zinc ABC transporter substrate-binding protein [Trueperaceae bacterium]